MVQYITLSLGFKWFRFSREQNCGRWQDIARNSHHPASDYV